MSSSASGCMLSGSSPRSSGRPSSASAARTLGNSSLTPVARMFTRYATVKGSYQDAQKELTRLLNTADSGTLPDPSTATVGGYLTAWLDSAREQSPKTLERYRELAE